MIRKKVIFIGNDGVGKSSIIIRKIKNQFSESYLPTLGCDFYEMDYPQDDPNSQLKLSIWDIASQRSFQNLHKHYISAASVCVVVIDIHRLNEDCVIPWIKVTEEYSKSPIPIIFSINKNDLEFNADICTKFQEEFLKQFSDKIILTSAKTGENINALFELIGKSCDTS